MTEHSHANCQLSSSRAIEIIGQFRSKSILVIGDVMIDRYVIGKVERINPEAPVPVLHAKSEHRATGGAGNTAKNAAALGASTRLIGVTGSDATSIELEETAIAEGYRPILVKDPSRSTIEKKRYMVGGQQMLRVDYEEIHCISEDIEQQVINAIHDESELVDAIIVSDYAKGLLTPNVAAEILATARSAGIPIMADVKPTHIEYFKGVSYISPNRKEAHEYLGLNPHLNGGLDKKELAGKLKSVFETNVFLTLSEDGIFVDTAETEGIHVPQVHPVEVADTSGCGDTAAVAIVLAKLSGASDTEVAHIGNGAGAIIASKIGAVALSQEELLQVFLT